MNTPLIVATKNKGKLSEIREILADTGIRVSGLTEHFPEDTDIPETGTTFEENARIKAAWIIDRCECSALADDSGLEVDALEGAPGVYSARFAGPGATDAHNNEKLLSLLGDTPRDRRTARFRCCMVLRFGKDSEIVARGKVEGHIAFSPSGANGFGYDPLFVPSGYSQSFACLDREIKNRISHRAAALDELRKRIAALSGSQAE